MSIVKHRYNWFTLGNIYSVKEEKDKLVVEIDKAEGSVGYLIGAIIVFFPLVSLTIGFIMYSYNPLMVKFVIFPLELSALIFLFLSGTYFLLLYLNHIYFQRASKYTFDKKLQKITHQSIIPKNKKDEIFELGKVQSVVYHRDKIDLYHDIIRLWLSFENGHSLRLIKARIPHFIYGSHNLGKLVSEFLDKPLVTEISEKLGFLEGNAVFFLGIYIFIELANRFPQVTHIYLTIIIIVIIISIIFNLSHLLGNTESRSVSKGLQNRKSSFYSRISMNKIYGYF